MDQQSLLDLLYSEEQFVISSHESPDGDALGSEAAFYLGLLSLHKEVYIVNSDPSENRYDYFLKDIPIMKPKEWLKKHDPSRFTLLILDTMPDNTGAEMVAICKQFRKVIPIDHHDTMSPEDRGPGYYNSQVSSTCEMIFELLTQLEVPITQTIAQALYTGIVYDTGSFKYKKTGPRTLFIASLLVEKGVNPFYIHTNIYESNTKASLLLLSRVMSSLKFHFNDQVSVLEMPASLLKETGANFEEAQTLINIPLGCKSVELSLFFKEDEKGQKRCSLRSKGNFNCLHIAEDFGGGGHETAAGFKFYESFESIRAKVLEDIGPFFT